MSRSDRCCDGGIEFMGKIDVIGKSSGSFRVVLRGWSVLLDLSPSCIACSNLRCGFYH